MNDVSAAASSAPFAAQLHDGCLAGPWRRPVSNARDEAGTIHDDATAQWLGFAAGPVAGSIHLEQFAPLLAAASGAARLRTGNLSLWFGTPAFDGEALQAAVQQGDTPRRAVRLLAADGRCIAHGTAAAGLDDGGEVRQRLAAFRRRAPGDAPRLLAALHAAAQLQQVVTAAQPQQAATAAQPWQVAGLPTRITVASSAERLPLMTEPPPDDGVPPRHRVPLASAVHALRVCEARLPLPLPADIGVGLFGAIEWQALAGPLRAGHGYHVVARVLAVGCSPRSEMLWTESLLRDPQAGGRAVARMLMLSRLLKQGSALWP